jgi:L-ascorbate metabolism protein UlaG (beta-lactamase superfamily)
MSSSDFVKAVWLGTAGLYVTDGETSFYIDPYVSRVSVLKVFAGIRLSPYIKGIDECINRISGQKASAVLVGHSHFDHLMDAPEFAKRTRAMLVGSESSANVARGAGLPEERIRVIRDGATLDLGAFNIRFIEGIHGPAFLGRIPYPGIIEKPLAPPARASDYRLGGFFAMVVNHPLGTFIHHGSAGWVPGMYNGVKADTVFMCLAGRKDTCAYLDEVARETGARCIIPIHHDWFFSPFDKGVSLLKGVQTDEFISAAMKTVPETEIRFVPVGMKFKVSP